MAKELAESITPLIIDNIKTQIEKNQKEKLSKLLDQNMIESQLVSFRSPIIKREQLYKGIETLILENDQCYEVREIAKQLTYVLM